MVEHWKTSRTVCHLWISVKKCSSSRKMLKNMMSLSRNPFQIRVWSLPRYFAWVWAFMSHEASRNRTRHLMKRSVSLSWRFFWIALGFDSPCLQNPMALYYFSMWCLSCLCLAFSIFFYFSSQSKIHISFNIYQNFMILFVECSSSCPLFFGDF